MTNSFSGEKSSEFLREITKLKVRLNDFLKEEEFFIEKLKNFIEKLEKAHGKIEKLRDKPEESAALRLEIVQTFNEVLKSDGETQHERSHLLESYGALILALEKELQKAQLKR
ncbi:MAG: hypothetical protein RMJ15_06725 [Nitrososphaerota archaeon]|nr:hypothetical protein [Candidatus Bathyarchaeota archaeon]MDW8023413.1 hypothetical protein [Nitrososphaerota archaeon]